MAPKLILTDPISYTEAGQYLADIKDNDLLTVYEKNLGGTFKANKLEKFVKEVGFSGLMFWFCLDNQNLFLACEPKFNFTYPEDDVVFSENLEPEHENLIQPGGGPFGKNLRGLGDHVGFVKNHSQSPHLQDRNINKRDVTKFKKKYEGDSRFKYHQKYGHAYFGNEEGYITDFFGIDGLKNVRYYFGYGDSYRPNYIRLILVPVDSNGANIQVKKIGRSGELLQRSVPPPPIQ